MEGDDRQTGRVMKVDDEGDRVVIYVTHLPGVHIIAPAGCTVQFDDEILFERWAWSNIGWYIETIRTKRISQNSEVNR